MKRHRKKSKSSCNPWTEKDIELLKDLLSKGYPRPEIAKILNRSKQSINHACHKNGLSTKREREWTEDEVTKLKLCLANGMIKKDIAKELGRTYKAVDYRCEKLGLRTREAYRPWTDQEEWILLDRVRRRNLSSISEEFGRSVQSIQHKLRENGTRWKDQHLSFKKAAEILGVSERSVHLHWKRVESSRGQKYKKNNRLSSKGLIALAQAILDNPNSQIKSTKKIKAVARGEWDFLEPVPIKRREWTKEEDRFLLHFCIENRQKTGAPGFRKVAAILQRTKPSVSTRYYRLVKGHR